MLLNGVLVWSVDARPDADMAPQATVAMPAAFTNDLRSVSMSLLEPAFVNGHVGSHRPAVPKNRVSVATAGLMVRLDAKPGKQEDAAAVLSSAISAVGSRATHDRVVCCHCSEPIAAALMASASDIFVRASARHRARRYPRQHFQSRRRLANAHALIRQPAHDRVAP